MFMSIYSSLTLLNTDNFLFALRQTSLTCKLKSRLDVKNNPKCLSDLTHSIKVSPNKSGGELFKHLLEKNDIFGFFCIE